MEMSFSKLFFSTKFGFNEGPPHTQESDVATLGILSRGSFLSFDNRDISSFDGSFSNLVPRKEYY